jgi:hypothetical protein
MWSQSSATNACHYQLLHSNLVSRADALQHAFCRFQHLNMPHTTIRLFLLPPLPILTAAGKRSAQQQQQQQQLPFLWGVLRYEDHVEDEWWAVWLLLTLSQQLPHLCIRVWDDDGEFLLIEVRWRAHRGHHSTADCGLNRLSALGLLPYCAFVCEKMTRRSC